MFTSIKINHIHQNSAILYIFGYYLNVHQCTIYFKLNCLELNYEQLSFVIMSYFFGTHIELKREILLLVFMHHGLDNHDILRHFEQIEVHNLILTKIFANKAECS